MGLLMWRDIRCNNSFKGRTGLGGWCGQLIMRITADSHGTVEHKCPRCKETKTTRIDSPAIIMATT